MKSDLTAFLALTISFTNFVRPGNVTNLTLEEFNVVINEGKTIWSVKVKEHKTKNTHGSGFIHMTASTFKLMNCYRKFFREGRIKHFFINRNGEQYSTPVLLSITKHLWNKCKVSDVEYAFGKVRHCIVSYIHTHNPEFKEPLAQQMLHSSKTASKYYRDLLTTKESQINFLKIHEELRKKQL